MGSKRAEGETRVQLSSAEKAAIVEYVDTHDIKQHSEVASFFAEKFNKKPSLATISVILKHREKWRQLADSEEPSHVKNRSRQRHSNVNGLETALDTWSRQIEGKGGFITGALLLAKAKEIGKELELPNNFNYSNKWLHKFKKQHGLSMHELHGEAGSADIDGVRVAREQVPQLVKELGISLDELFNLDETGLWFRRLPTRTLARESRAGNKLAKDRVTTLVTVNATGTMKPNLWVIGKSKKPRSFGRTWTPKDVNIVYKNSKKAWMTGEIFNEYCAGMNKFAEDKHRATGRKLVFTIMDNASTQDTQQPPWCSALGLQRSTGFRDDPHHLGVPTQEHDFSYSTPRPRDHRSYEGSVSLTAGTMGHLGG